MATEVNLPIKKRQLLEMLGSELPKSFGPKRCKTQEVSIEPLVNDLFHKRIAIRNDNFVLPEANAMFTESPWQLEGLQKLKRELNEVKNQLNDYNLMEWHRHTSRRNKAGDVQWRLRKDIDPEFLTQAWCKFYETACSFPLVPRKAVDDGELMSVHLCEAPGAFVASLNHWLKTNAPDVHWDWMATTLNPYYEGNSLSRMIDDDRFIVHTLAHWCFGADRTGNLMDLRNMDALLERSRDLGKVQLVTADGSIDCMDSPGEQEAVVAQLHFCEAVAALHILDIGGSFLLKMFTIFEHEAICLVFLLACSFKQVFLSKPVTSKEGNSEVYLVCLNYKGPEYTAPHLDILRQHYGRQSTKSMFRRADIPDKFFDQILACGEFFKAHQTAVISNNIETFQGQVDPAVRKIRHVVADRFIREYELKRLDDEELQVVGKSKLVQVGMIDLGKRVLDCSFNDRLRVKEHSDPVSQLMALSSELRSIESPEMTQWIQLDEPLGNVSICEGKPFQRVWSSKFCTRTFLKARNKALDLANSILSDDTLSREPYSQEALKTFIKDTQTASGKNEYLHFGSIQDANSHATLIKICEQLKVIEKGNSLVLVGYSLLTQLNVGVLHILARTFDSLGLILNDSFGCLIILKSYRAVSNILESFDKIHDAAVKADAEGKAILSVLPITELCESDLYSCIVGSNHWTVKNYVDRLAELLRTKTEA